MLNKKLLSVWMFGVFGVFGVFGQCGAKLASGFAGGLTAAGGQGGGRTHGNYQLMGR